MNARCTGCGRTVSWYAGRGRRLSELRSRCCSAILEGMAAHNARPGIQGPMHTCPVCGKRRRRSTMRPLPERRTYSCFSERRGAEPVAVEAGELVCWFHDMSDQELLRRAE